MRNCEPGADMFTCISVSYKAQENKANTVDHCPLYTHRLYYVNVGRGGLRNVEFVVGEGGFNFFKYNLINIHYELKLL